MAKRKITWSEFAYKDMDSILDYTVNSAQGKVETIFKKIMTRIRSLENHAEIGRIIPELEIMNITIFREIIEPPWRIFYRYDKDFVYILAVFDGRRDLSEIILRRLL